MERSEIREQLHRKLKITDRPLPHCASLHAGYGRITTGARKKSEGRLYRVFLRAAAFLTVAAAADGAGAFSLAPARSPSTKISTRCRTLRCQPGWSCM